MSTPLDRLPVDARPATKQPAEAAATPPPARPTLLQTLRRAQLRMTLLSTVVLGLALSVAALLALRIYATHNLQLLARTVAYTVEAAMVFHDPVAVQEQVELVAQNESLELVRVVDPAGLELARYVPEPRTPDGLLQSLGDRLALLLMPEPTTVVIVHHHHAIGQVELRADGTAFASFIGIGAASLPVCMLVVAWGMRQWSRRIQRDLIDPLRTLGHVTQQARMKNGVTRRAPALAIAELHQLGQDFNALLDEVASHQASLAQENRSLSHLAHHDSLTGLANRAQFLHRLERLLHDPASRQAGVALLYLDLDRFKQVNDQYGHAVGDLLLTEVAERVRHQLRETDLVARLGGDEFALLLTPLHAESDARRIADKIRVAAARPLSAPHQGIVPSLSIGIALYPQHASTATELVQVADHAMYAAKRAGRGGHHVYDSTHDAAEPR